MKFMKPYPAPCKHSRQHGMALIMGLIFLVTLTLLGMAAMRGTILEERMAGNARDRDLAFQSAEAAIRVAEQGLAGTPPALTPAPPPDDGTGTLSAYWQNTHNWNDADSIQLGWQPAGTNAAPRYVVESMAPCSSSGSLVLSALGTGVYRVTARGVGRSANTVVILQAIFETC